MASISGDHLRFHHTSSISIVLKVRLVVKLDGSPHCCQQGYDQLPDAYMAGCGICLLHVGYHVVRDDLAAVIHVIRNVLWHLP